MSAEVTLTIDGREITVPAGTLIIRAAEQVGAYVPRFCDHPLLDPLGACRQCLVEVEGQGKPLTACTTPVADGMIVRTQATSDIAREGQDGVLELLLINHPLDCPMCDKGGECPLQDQALAYGPGGSRYVDAKRRFTKPVPISPLVKLDRERCVLCARCTRFASEISGDPFIELFERGALEQVAIFEDEPYQSEFSGNVIQICPVGALTSSTFRFLARPFDMTTTPSTCNRCPAGCAIDVQQRRGQLARVLARRDLDANDEWLCDKGRFGYAYAHAPDRILEPMVRKGDEHVAVSWSEAFEAVGEHVRAARASGARPRVVAGRHLLDEDAYALSRFARTVLATDDIQLAAARTDEDRSLLAALPRARTAGYGDIDRARVAVVVGADLQQEAPIVFLRLRRNQRKNGLRVVEVGARRSALAASGAEWIPTAPGGEAGAMLAIAAALEAAGGSGLDPLTRAAAGGPDARDIIDASGADSDTVAALGAALAAADGAFVILAGQAAERSQGARALGWNIASALGGSFGWIARGAGTGGAAAAGLFSGGLPGGAEVDAVEELWGVRPDDAAAPASPTFVVGADPVGDGDEFSGGPLIAIDVLMNDTARRADVVLPAAAVYERSGTLTGWDGVARPVRAAIDAPGMAMADPDILAGIGALLGAHVPEPDALRREMIQLRPARETPRPVPVPVLVAAAAGELMAVPVPRLLDDGAMMAGADALRSSAGDARIEISPGDATGAGIGDGDVVRLISERGAVSARARVTARIANGVVGVPIGSPGIDARALLDPDAAGTVVRLERGES